MAVIVRISKIGNGDNFFEIEDRQTLSELFGGEFGIGKKFKLGKYDYKIENIGISGFLNNPQTVETVDGEFSPNTTLYFYCNTDDPRAKDFQDNLDTLKEDVEYYKA